MNMLTKICSWSKKGEERSRVVKKNILYSFAVRFVSILMSFLLVPVTIDYLNPMRYGIWITLSTILSWIDYFDLGLGNGLKNRLTEALAYKDYKKAVTYVSTSYAILTIIAMGFIVLFYCTIPFFDWSEILNTPSSYREELMMVILVVTVFFGVNFVCKLITVVLHSFQKVALSNSLNLLGNFLSLLIIFILVRTKQPESLLLISTIFSAMPVLVLLIASFFLFHGKLKDVAPNIKAIDFSCSRDLLGLGIQFFVIQISNLVVFSTSNFLISHLFSPTDVTSYNIAFKYFNIVTMAFQIMVAPLWPAYTDAYSKRDYEWIKRTTRKMCGLWVLMSVGVVCMVAISSFFYHLWVGNAVYVPWKITLTCALYVILFTWYNVFMYVINATGKVRLQMYYSIVSMIITIPIAIYISRFIGPSGVVVGMIVGILPSVIFAPWQYYKLFYGRPSGVWIK